MYAFKLVLTDSLLNFQFGQTFIILVSRLKVEGDNSNHNSKSFCKYKNVHTMKDIKKKS